MCKGMGMLGCSFNQEWKAGAIKKGCVCMQKIDLEEIFAVLRTTMKYKNFLQIDKKNNPVEKYVTRRT